MIYKGSCHCADPKGNQMAAVNARCLEGIELSSLTVKNFNGRAL